MPQRLKGRRTLSMEKKKEIVNERQMREFLIKGSKRHMTTMHTHTNIIFFYVINALVPQGSGVSSMGRNGNWVKEEVRALMAEGWKLCTVIGIVNTPHTSPNMPQGLGALRMETKLVLQREVPMKRLKGSEKSLVVQT